MSHWANYKWSVKRDREKNTEWEPVKRGQARSLHLQVKVVVVREEAVQPPGEWPMAAEQGMNMKKRTHTHAQKHR